MKCHVVCSIDGNCGKIVPCLALLDNAWHCGTLTLFFLPFLSFGKKSETQKINEPLFSYL